MLAQVTDRELASHLFEKLVVRGAEFVELSLERSWRQTELSRDALERRIAAAKFTRDDAAHLIDYRVARWKLRQQLFGVTIEQRTKTGVCFRDCEREIA